jgi:hypothetical protein
MNTSKKTAVCLLILAIALAGCTASGGKLTVQPACSGGAVSSDFSGIWMGWQGISFLAASTIWVVSILAYTLGYALDHQKTIIWAKEQMGEAVLAMAITFFVVGFVSFLCSLNMNSLGIGSTCGVMSGNFIDVGFGCLSSMYATILQGYLLVIGMNSALAAAATITMGFAPGGVGVVFAPFAFLAEVANSLLLATITLMTAAVLTLTQMVLLKMTASIFVILFPIGVILRSFGVTRGFGGGLIAIAIGFFIFYPLLVVLFYGAVTGDISNDYTGLRDSVKNVGLSPTGPDWFGGGLLGSLAGFIGKTIMGAIFIPLIMFMILISFVKGLSMALGEEVDVSNLTRLI